MSVPDAKPDDERANREAGCAWRLLGAGALAGVVMIAASRLLDPVEQAGGARHLLLSGCLAFVAAVAWIVPLRIRIRQLQAAELEPSEDVLEKQHPDEPWRWKHHWNENRIPGSTAGGAWVWSALFTVVTVPLFPALLVRLDDWHEGLEEKATLVGMSLVWLLLGIVALSQVLQARKFGESELALDPMPPRTGSSFVGRVSFRGSRRPSGEIFVTLSCNRSVSARYAKSRERMDLPKDDSTSHVPWRTILKLPADRASVGGGRVHVQLQIELPEDVPATGSREFLPIYGGGREEIDWQLTVRVPFPGIGFAASFPVPVFHPESPEDSWSEWRKERELRFRPGLVSRGGSRSPPPTGRLG